jgi:insertion element IS1 protein InsB
MDELHTYIGHKKLLLGLDCSRSLGIVLLIFFLGKRDYTTGSLLWESLKNKAIKRVMSDHWKVYSQLVEADKLIQSKRETYTVEGYNTRLRHYLARLKRKTLCYSKSWPSIGVY